MGVDHSFALACVTCIAPVTAGAIACAPGDLPGRGNRAIREVDHEAPKHRGHVRSPGKKGATHTQLDQPGSNRRADPFLRLASHSTTMTALLAVRFCGGSVVS